MKDQALGEGYRVFVRAIDPNDEVLVTIPALTNPDRGIAACRWPEPSNAGEAMATAGEVVKRIARIEQLEASWPALNDRLVKLDPSIRNWPEFLRFADMVGS